MNYMSQTRRRLQPEPSEIAMNSGGWAHPFWTGLAGFALSRFASSQSAIPCAGGVS